MDICIYEELKVQDEVKKRGAKTAVYETNEYFQIVKQN